MSWLEILFSSFLVLLGIILVIEVKFLLQVINELINKVIDWRIDVAVQKKELKRRARK